MSPAASFGQRWAEDNLAREASTEEIRILNLFLTACDNDEYEASKRARRYYTARGPGGLTDLWHHRHPDDEDILSSCQDAYVIPLKARSLSGRRVTIIRLPAPMASDRPLSARALLARWLMIMDLRLREDPTPGDETVFIDVCDLQPSHLKNHFKGSYWKDFAWCIKMAYPIRFAEVHIINTQRLKTMSLLLLHIGLYPWRRKIVHVHAHADQIYNVDFFSSEGLPYEYGGKAGAMKDLNDEWTNKLLSSAKWLQMEERKYYEAELKPKDKHKSRQRSSIRNLRRISSYDILTRSNSCRSLNKDDVDEGTPGNFKNDSDPELCFEAKSITARSSMLKSSKNN